MRVDIPSRAGVTVHVKVDWSVAVKPRPWLLAMMAPMMCANPIPCVMFDDPTDNNVVLQVMLPGNVQQIIGIDVQLLEGMVVIATGVIQTDPGNT